MKIFLLALLFSLSGLNGYATIVVTPAGGGTGICGTNAADGSTASFTTLGTITLTEGAVNDLSIGTNQLVLDAPSGWTFNTVMPSVAFTAGRNITSISGSISSTQLSINIDVSALTLTDGITITGLQIQATNTTSTAGTIVPSLAAGLFGVTAGSTNFGSLSLIAPATPSVTISGSPSGAICAGTGVTFTPTPTTGGGAPTYQWYLNGAPVATGFTYSNSSLANGNTIAVVLTSSASCLATSTATSNTITMTVNAIPATTTVSGAGTFCGSTTITADNGSDGTMYFQGTTSNGTSTTTASSSASISTSGTYYFRARSSSGCWGAQGSATVTINANPSAVTVSGGGSVCASTTLTASGGAGGTVYFQGTTSSGTSTATPSTSQSVSSSGTYYFRSRSAAGCWGTEGSATVTVNSLPAATTASGAGTFCGSTTITASNGSDGTMYFQGTTSGGTSTATPSASQVVSTSGTYYFRAQNAAGCWGPEGSVAVTINANPSAVTVSGGGAACGTATLLASGGAGGTVYFQGTTASGTSTATASTSQAVTSSGTYYFRSQSAAGCWGTEGSATVTINTIPAATTASGAGTFCGSTTITADNGSDGTMYFQGTVSGGTSTATPSASQVVATSGTYYFRAQSAAGCWGPQGSVAVTIDALPNAVTVSGGGSFCGGPTTITATNGSSGTIYFQGTTSGGTSTATPSTSESIASSGLYYFRARSAAGCWGTEGSTTVTINSLPTIVTVSGGGAVCGSTILTATNGSSGTIYYQGTTSGGTSTATPSTFQSITTAGTYYFRAQSAAGCWGPEGSSTVTINPLPAAVTASGAGTFCGSTTITASGGAGGTIYFQGATTGGTSTATPSSSQSVSSTGTYFFRSQTAAGCWGTEGSVAVTINPIPTTVTVSGGGTFCNNATITASNGGSGTMYFQGTTSGGTSTATPSSSQVVSTSGTYYFRALSGTGCWGPEGSATIVINPNPGAVTASGAGTFCGSTTITATGGSGGTIYFQGTTSGGTSVATPSASEVVSTSGTYYFRAQSALGCWGTESAVIVTINALPATPTVSGAGTFCGNTTITAANGGDGTMYFQGTTSGGTSTATPSSSQVVSSGGTYYFRARSAGGCWGNEGSVTVSINPLPTTTTVSGGGVFCGGTTTLTAANGGDGTMYFQGTTTGGTSTATPSSSEVIGSSGTYFFRARSSAGCWGVEGSANVTINSLPVLATVGGAGTFCGSTIITATNGGSGTMYFQGTTSGGTSTAIPSTFQNITTSGTYYFRALSAAGCWGPEGSAVVTINPLPTAVTASGGGTFCGSATITAANGGDGTIYFQGGTSGGTSTATPATSRSITVSGTYYFRAQSGLGCWGPEGSVTVTILPLPAVVTVSGGGTFCDNATLTANNGGDGTMYYQGTTTGGTSTAIPSTSQVVTASGTYYFRALSAAGCWGPEGSAVITINPLPAATTVSGAGTFCNNATITASNGGDGIMYFQGVVSGGTSTAIPSTSQVVSASGTYYFRARSATGCWGPEGSVTVTINPLPTAVTVLGAGTFCQSTTISASNGGSGTIFFQGNTSGGTSTAFPSVSEVITASGTYYFRAQSASGCWGNEGSVTVTINPLPATPLVTGGGTFCGNTNITATNGGDGTMYFQGTTTGGTSVATPATTQVISASGTYYFRALSASGCWSNEGSVTVTINPLPATVVVAGAGTYCGSTTILAGNGGDGTIYYQATTTGGTSILVPSVSEVITTSGTYYFRAQSAAGCWGAEGNASVVINPLPATPSITGGGTVCGTTTIVADNGGDGVMYFQGITSGGTSTGTPSSSQVITTSGTYYFRALSGAGCWGAENSVSVTVNPLPTVVSVTGGGTFCDNATLLASNGADGTIYFQGTTAGGTSTADMSTSEIVTASGRYYFRAQSALGCWGPQGSAAVTINPLPAVVTVSEPGTGVYCDNVTITADNGGDGTIYFQGTTSGGTSIGSPSTSEVITASGTYYFRARTAVGCWGPEGSITVTVNPLPTAFTVTGGGSYCTGGPGQVVGLSSSELGVTYELYISFSPTGIFVAGTGAAIDFGPQTASGFYTIVGTNDLTGCTNNMASGVAVVPIPLPVAYNVTGGGNYCAGGAGVAVGLDGSEIGVNYQLYIGSTPVGAALAGTGSPLDFGLQLGAGTYSIVGTDGSTTCSDNMVGTVAIAIDPLPTIFNVTGGGTYCAGGVGFNVFLGGSEVGIDYQLYNGSGAVGTALAGTGGGLDFGLLTAAGTYTVAATNPITGCTVGMADSADIIVNAAPVAYDMTGGGSYCSGGTGVRIGLSNSDIGFDYQLYESGSALGGPLAGTGAPIDFGMFTVASTYSVVATNITTGCTNEMNDTVVITVNPLPGVHAVTGGGTICAGDAGVSVGLLTSDLGIDYQLYVGSTTVGSPVPGTGAALSFGLMTTAGTYTVTAIDATTGCTENMAGSVDVFVNPQPLAFTVVGGGAYCAGGTGYTVDISGSEVGVDYQLLLGGVPTGAPVSGTGFAISFGTLTAPGIYTVLATNTSTFCSNTMSSSATITVNTLPVVMNVSGGGNYCTGGSGVAIVLSGSEVGVSYQLYIGSTAVGTPIAGTGASISTTVFPAGTYTVVATNVTTGCTENMTGSATVVEDPLPASITGTPNICIGGTGTVSSATAGGNWTSSNSSIATIDITSGVLTSVSLGTFTISYTLPTTGCAVSVAASVNSIPVVDVITGPTAVCVGGTVLFNDITPFGTWSSNDPSIATVDGSGNVTGVLAGTATISYTVTSGAGCSAFATKDINVLPIPVVSPITGAPNVCAGLNIPLNNATPSGTWSTSNAGIATVSATGLVTGVNPGSVVISYTVTNAAGCSSTVTYVLVVGNAMPTMATLPSGSATLCNGDPVNMLLSTTGTGLTFQWSVGGTPISGANASNYVATTAGVYTIRVDNGSCAAILPAIVVVDPPMPVIAYDTASVLLFTGSFASYQWYRNGVAIPGANSSILADTTWGVYTVIVSDGNGCSDTSAEFVFGVVTGVKDLAGQSNIRIYPNPVSSVLFVDADIPVSMTIIGADGKVLMDRREGVNVNVSQLTPGVYMIQVYNMDQVLLKTERFIKMQ